MPRRLESIIVPGSTLPALDEDLRLLSELAQLPARHREGIRRMVEVLRSFCGAVPPGLRSAIDDLFESDLSADDKYRMLDTILANWTTHH